MFFETFSFVLILFWLKIFKKILLILFFLLYFNKINSGQNNKELFQVKLIFYL